MFWPIMVLVLLNVKKQVNLMHNLSFALLTQETKLQIRQSSKCLVEKWLNCVSHYSKRVT